MAGLVVVSVMESSRRSIRRVLGAELLDFGSGEMRDCQQQVRRWFLVTMWRLPFMRPCAPPRDSRWVAAIVLVAVALALPQ